MLTDAKSTSETQKTDESLRSERLKTDSEVEKKQASIEADADSVLLQARQKADQVLETARDRADVRLDQESAPAKSRDTLKQERLQADSVLEKERNDEDRKLSDEHEERKGALANLFSAEREETDNDLLSERVRQLQQARSAEHAFHNLNLRIEAQAKMLEQAEGARESFLSLASHELRTPLTSLQLQVQTLLRDARASVGLVPPATLSRLSNAEEQVRKLEELIGQLLDASGLAGETAGLETVDLSALIRELATRMAPAVGIAQCDLVLDIVPNVEGEWERFRLVQVITNLVGNALKFGAGKSIRVSLQEEAAVARLCVQDRGIGVDAQHHRRIFRRFERAVSDRNYGGFGLGLWIVQRNVDALGGKVTISSQLGCGATFVVELPTRKAIKN